MVDGIVVCIGLAKDLVKTLPWNRHHLDRLVVVTSSKDEDTIDTAWSNNTEVVICDDYNLGADSFNKGVLLNAALDHIELTEMNWTLFFDADVMLSPWLPNIDTGTLDKNALYYTTRHQIQTEAEMADVKDDWKAVMRLPHGPIDSMPYGYFQLWHPEAECLEPDQRVSTQFPTAGGVDQWWAFRWPRSKWGHLAAELDVGHLSHGGFGARWNGTGSRDPDKWQWVGWSRGERTQVEPMPHGGVFWIIALDTGGERLFFDSWQLNRNVEELRANGSTEQIDIYWRLGS